MMESPIIADGETKYKIKAGLRQFEVSPAEILSALYEQAENEDEHPDEVLKEDLCGWSLIHATDEQGKSRPFCIMRSLPGHYQGKYCDVRGDDENMASIIIEDVYKLTKRRIKWMRAKKKWTHILRRFFKSTPPKKKPIRIP